MIDLTMQKAMNGESGVKRRNGGLGGAKLLKTGGGLTSQLSASEGARVWNEVKSKRARGALAK